MPDEHVLCVATSAFRELGDFQGFNPDAARYLSGLLRPEYLSFQPRSTCESDPTFKQLIPYIVLRCGGRIFCYRRRNGDPRLERQLSLGVGGHINADDALLRSDPADWYDAGMQRELHEEVEIHCEHGEPRLLGLINDDSTDVNAVHLGVVHVIDLQQPTVTPKEDAMQTPAFMQEYQVRLHLPQFETWSRIAFAQLTAVQPASAVSR